MCVRIIYGLKCSSVDYFRLGGLRFNFGVGCRTKAAPRTEGSSGSDVVASISAEGAGEGGARIVGILGADRSHVG